MPKQRQNRDSRASRDARPNDRGEAMKNVILVCTLAGSMAWAQSPQVVQNTRTALNAVQIAELL